MTDKGLDVDYVGEEPLYVEEHTDEPVNYLNRTDCIHRGDTLRWEGNSRCGRRGKRTPIFRCNVFGEASYRRYKHNQKPAVCMPLCERYRGRDEAMEEQDYYNYFDKVYVINLDRRPDRWQKFMQDLPADWPFKEPERIQAIDGKKVHAPGFWKPGSGAWGCYRTHVRLIEDGLNNGSDRILLLEDDAVFAEDFVEKVKTYIDHLPQEWDIIYLGGQHLREKKVKPRRFNEYVYEPFNVNRTHAFAVSLSRFGRELYKYLHDWQHWKPNHHIDHHLGRLHETRKYRVYVPSEWLVGQREGKSNISGRDFGHTRFWRPAHKSGAANDNQGPFYAVLGLHSSGSSALAGVLYHLGVHMGNNLIGFYGRDPNKSCGFEAEGLAKIGEQVAKLRDTETRIPSRQIEEKLRWFINQKRREARKKGTVAGGKYPQLCVCGDELRYVLGDSLRVVVADRSLEESIASIQRRTNSPGDERLAAHQKWLHAEREKLVATLPANHVLRVEYADLLDDTETVVKRVAAFLGFDPKPERIEKAISYVDPSRRHVFAETV